MKSKSIRCSMFTTELDIDTLHHASNYANNNGSNNGFGSIPKKNSSIIGYLERKLSTDDAFILNK